MNWPLIFNVVLILSLIIGNALVLVGIYNAIRVITGIKKSVLNFLDSPDSKDFIAGLSKVFGTSTPKPGLDQFEDGYIVGIREYLQQTFDEDLIEYLPSEKEQRIRTFIESANKLDVIKEIGEFILIPPNPPYSHKYFIAFEETAAAEQRNESKD